MNVFFLSVGPGFWCLEWLSGLLLKPNGLIEWVVLVLPNYPKGNSGNHSWSFRVIHQANAFANLLSHLNASFGPGYARNTSLTNWSARVNHCKAVAFFYRRCSGTWDKLVSRTVTIYIINIRDTMLIWLVHWLLLFDIELYKYDLRRVKCLANEGNWCLLQHSLALEAHGAMANR